MVQFYLLAELNRRASTGDKDASPIAVRFWPQPGSLDPGPMTSFPSCCYSCGALCGMTAKVKDGVLIGTTGLPGAPKGAARLCPKGAPNSGHVYSAYRLKEPLIMRLVTHIGHGRRAIAVVQSATRYGRYEHMG